MAANVMAASFGFTMFSRLLSMTGFGGREVAEEFKQSNEVIFSIVTGNAVSYSHPKRVRQPRNIVERRNP